MNGHQEDWLEAAVGREGALLFSDHPRSEDLVLFVENPASLAPSLRADLQDHLRLCDECADDLARLRLAERELAAEGSGISRGHSGRPALSRTLSPRTLVPWTLVPLAAAALLAFAVVGLDRDDPLVRPVGPMVVLRAETERGEATVATARPGLALSFELPGEGNHPISRCTVRILDGSGAVVVDVGQVEAFDAYGTFLLTVDDKGLSPGDYVLEAKDRLGARRFPLTIKRDP